MNNNEIIFSKKDKENQANETEINLQSKITEISSEKKSEEKTDINNNEISKNNNHLYKELLIEDSSGDKNEEKDLNENKNESIKDIDKINDLNDYYSSEEYNEIIDRPKNFITVNDIIGEDSKKEINLNIMDESFINFYPGKVSTKSYGPIKSRNCKRL